MANTTVYADELVITNDRPSVEIEVPPVIGNPLMQLVHIDLKKNVAAEIEFPMYDISEPGLMLTGLTVTDTAYYRDGGSWTSLSISDSVSEIGSTGMYQISLSAGELNHDQIVIKFSSMSGGTLLAPELMYVIKTYDADVDDLVRSTTPANTLDVAATGEVGLDFGNTTGTHPNVNLADDAITSAKYDETTAYPLASADSGATEVARTGADGDTLKTLSDQIDGITPSDPAAVADAVWDELLSGHTGAGSFGKSVADIESDATAILADTNEMQGKLPDNNIMGSSVTTDKDDEIDAIKAVTDNLPNSGALTDIDTGVNNIEAKLPTNYIMGSSVQTDKDDEIDAIKAKTDNLPADPASETNVDANETKIDSLIAGVVLTNAGVDAIFERDSSNYEDGNFRTLAGAVSKLVNRVKHNTGTGKLEVYKSDDTTKHGEQTATTSGGAAPITELNTD